MKKRFKFLLILSLCLNIFLIGFIAGEVRHFKPKRETSQLVKDFINEHKEEQQQLNKERRRALNMLREDNFDQEAYAEQVEKIGAMQKVMFQQFATRMGEKLRAMPKEERDTIIDRLKERRSNMHHRHGL